MATSGSINLTATALDIIKEALEQVGAIPENGTPTSAQQTSSMRTLNYLIKALQSDGDSNLFAIQRCILFLTSGTKDYILGGSARWATGAVVTTTTLAASYAIAATTLDLASITGLADTDVVGIQLDDGTMQWTTISGTPAGGAITIATGLTSAASSGNVVYSYSVTTNRPMKLLNGVLKHSNGDEIPLEFYTLDEYITTPNKDDTGPVNAVYYDPQVTSATLSCWPSPDSSTDYLELWVQRTIEDVDVTTDDVDFPQEWFLALSLQLAVLLANKYGLTRAEKQELMTEAQYWKDAAEGYDREGMVSITPEDRP